MGDEDGERSVTILEFAQAYIIAATVGIEMGLLGLNILWSN